MLTIIALLLVGAVAWRATTPEERARVFGFALDVLRRANSYGRTELEPFRTRLRARMPFALVTTALVALNVVLFIRTLFGGDGSGATALVAWGASLGPRTTNGEWWRLGTALFVHASLLALIVDTAALVQLGSILERLVGRLGFATAYVVAGIFGGLASLELAPVSVSAGSSCAVAGLYGVFLASLAIGWWRRSELRVPLAVVQRLLPVTALFVLYNLVVADVWTGTATVSLGTGILFGIFVVGEVGERNPPPRRIGAAAGAALAAALVAAFFLRGILDVQPELEGLSALEERTTGAYREAVEQFRSGRSTVGDLTNLIERSILPELEAAEARIAALDGVPRLDRPRLDDAREYLELRAESWRLRVEGLRTASRPAEEVVPVSEDSDLTTQDVAEAHHRTTTRTLGRAEATERRSLDALERAEQALGDRPANP